MNLILQAIKSMFRGVYSYIDKHRTHYDTRQIINTPKTTVSGTTVMWGSLKVSDSIDFDINDVVSLTRSGTDGLSVTNLPVVISLEYEDAVALISFTEEYNDMFWGVYLSTQAAADNWWGSSEDNPFTPGLYLWSGGDDIHDCEITYSFTLHTGELKKLDKKYLPDTIATVEQVEKVTELAIKNPEEASVGQTIVVKSVDENGKPTEWEAVDLPGGGGGNISVDTTLTQSGKAADAKAVGDALAEQGKTIPKVFKWANSELPFTKNEISGVASGGGFVVNPTNFADGKTYFRYNAGATYGFRWTNPNPQKGSLTITMRGYSQYSTTMTTGVFVVYMGGTESRILLTHGETVTYTTDPDKTVDYIRGNYDFENWVLLDMDALSIVADYPAPAGTVKSVNGILPDENGNVQVPTLDGTLVEPAEDDIPKVFFGGALQQTKDEKVVPFRYISKTQDISGYAEIKAQGNSSMNYPKKNQTVKLFKDAECTEKLKVDFKGWGKQNKHVYKANWIDLTHARNVVSARLWGDVVKSRANFAELPEELRTSPNVGAVDGFPVKVYADGVYQGRYTLNIPKDKWTFNMDDDLEEHCVLCGENYASGCFRATAKIDESDWTDEIHDVVPTSIKTRWNQVINFVMNSTDEDFRANLGNYFYVDSLIDYYLFGLASCGLDAFGKNQIYATYDGQRWIASMYDMDSTWGLYWNGSKFVSASYGRNEFEDMVQGRQGNLLYMRLEQLFSAELQTRWEELKNGALSIENIINRFERFTDIAPAELVKEDYASTTGGGNFTGIPSKDTNNIQQIRSFALARQAWTDSYVVTLSGESGGENPEPDIPEVPDHTHSYTSSVTKAATCTTDGVRTYNCSCGHSYTEAILATGHNYVGGVCTVCGADERITWSDTPAYKVSSSGEVISADGYISNIFEVEKGYCYRLSGGNGSGDGYKYVQLTTYTDAEEFSSVQETSQTVYADLLDTGNVGKVRLTVYPYNNMIPNLTKVKLVREGIWSNKGGFTIGADGSISTKVNSDHITLRPIEVEPGATYRFAGKNGDLTTWKKIYVYAEDGSLIQNTSGANNTNAVELTMPNNAAYVRLSCYRPSGPIPSDLTIEFTKVL